MHLIASTARNHSSLAIPKMDDKELIMTMTLSYLFVSFLIHIVFFLATVFNNQCQCVHLSRYIFQRCWQRRNSHQRRTGNTVPMHMEQYHSNLAPSPVLKSLVDEQVLSISSSLSSDLIIESETILHRTIRSFGLLLCSCLLITNALRLGIFLIPTFHPSIIEASSTICSVQGFLLHVFSLFHFNLTISIRLFWHYCFILSQYWQTVTYSRLCAFLSSLLILFCLLTWPSLSNEWGSIFPDPILQICLVDYTFQLSYTFFILILTCFIPFILLVISHHQQMKSIDRRIEKQLATLTIEPERPSSQIHFWRKQFHCASWVILIWSFVNMLLLIGIHVPSEHRSIKLALYYMQMTAFLVDPLLYIFIFRSLNIVTVLRPAEKPDL